MKENANVCDEHKLSCPKIAMQVELHSDSMHHRIQCPIMSNNGWLLTAVHQGQI
jgi:hypothetical protein